MLRATAALASSTSEFSGNVTVATAPSPLTVVKSSVVFSDPFNGTTNPKAIPASFVNYTLVVNNPGAGAVDANTVFIFDAVPANTDLFVGDLGGAGSGPVAFTDGAPASGLTTPSLHWRAPPMT